MKNLSLKQKLTILSTVLMTVNICAVLAVLFSLSNRDILSSVQNRLRESVTGAFDDIDWEDGRLDFDSDILELENGVYLSVYDMDGTLLYGKILTDLTSPWIFGTVRCGDRRPGAWKLCP